MRIFYDSQDLIYKKPFGAAEINTNISLSVLVEGDFPGELLLQAGDFSGAENFSGEPVGSLPSIKLRLYRAKGGCSEFQLSQSPDNFPEGSEKIIIMNPSKRQAPENAGLLYSVAFDTPAEPCLLYYYFIIEFKGRVFYYGNNKESLGGEGSIYDGGDIPSYQITVYKKAEAPAWFKDSIVYQIFPDRFCRGRNFDEGKLRKLLDTRGDVLRRPSDDWYKPPVNIFNDAHTEISEWEFYGGSLEGIREKLDYLKGLGVTCIYLNPIFRARSTHRYDTSDYFVIDPALGSEEDFKNLCADAKIKGIHIVLDGVFNHCGKDSIYFDGFGEFEKEYPGSKGAYNHADSKYRSWFTFYDNGTYRSWWNINDLPDFDTKNQEYIDFITGENGVIKKWLSLGASGWRLDVADELPNEFLKKIRAAVKDFSEDAVLLGEVWDDATNKYNYGHLMEYFMGDELDCCMGYPFRLAALSFVTGTISASEFVRRFMNLAENYPRENLYANLNLLGSHDRERLLNVLGGYPLSEYGMDYRIEYKDLDEATYDVAKKRYKMLSILQYFLPGVPDIYYGDEAGQMGGNDPDNRRTYPWGKEDEDLISHFRWLGEYYHAHPSLRDGDFKLTALSDDVLAVERWLDSDLSSHKKTDRQVLIINRTGQFLTVSFDGRLEELWPYGSKIL